MEISTKPDLAIMYAYSDANELNCVQRPCVHLIRPAHPQLKFSEFSAYIPHLNSCSPCGYLFELQIYYLQLHFCSAFTQTIQDSQECEILEPERDTRHFYDDTNCVECPTFRILPSRRSVRWRPSGAWIGGARREPQRELLPLISLGTLITR